MVQPDAQVTRVLDIERHLRPNQQDDPVEIGPDQRGNDDREAGVDHRQARGVEHEQGEEAADRSPENAGGDAAGERRPKAHRRVRDHHVDQREQRRGDRIGRGAQAERHHAHHQRQLGQFPQRRAVSRQTRQPDHRGQQHRSNDQQRDVLGDAARQVARHVHVPDEVEAILDLLHGADQGVDQQRQADRTHQPAAHLIGKFHHLRGELIGRAAHRPEEITHQRFQHALGVEAAQNAEAEGEQRNDGEQAGVHQAHRVQIELAAGKITQQRERVARQAAQQAAEPRLRGFRTEQQPIRQLLQPGEDPLAGGARVRHRAHAPRDWSAGAVLRDISRRCAR